MDSGYFATAVTVVALLGFVAFGQWLRHQRRVMTHRERLAAVEKGLTLPPELDAQQRSWSVQRILLFAGLVWISLGIGAYVVLSAIVANPSEASKDIPAGIQYIGVAPIGIGLSHLIAFLVGRRRD